jgi:outer membrane protein assembly factor BamB
MVDFLEPMQKRALQNLSWLAVVCILVGSQEISAEDWPQWRGVGRDGVVHDPQLLETLPEGSLPQAWSQPVGSGYSGPTVADGRVYVTDQVRENVERVLCFDAAKGKPLWQHEYDAVYTIGYRAGPRASVTVHDGRAFAVGAMGHFHCFDAASGEVLWQRDLAADYNAAMPIWGITASPLVYDDLVIQVAAGQGGACVVALEAATGKERWKALDEPAGYSAPVVIQQGGQDVVVCWTGASISGLKPSTGKVFWSIPMASRNMPIGVATPVIQDDLLFVSSFYDGSMLIRFSRTEPTAEQVWRRVGRDEKNTDALHCMISTPILKGDHIYGVDSYGELRCLDLATGDRVWEDLTAVPRNRWATIHIIRDGDREIMLNDSGDLIFATLAPDGFHEQSRAHLIDPTRVQLSRGDGVVWAHPAIANGFIFARSDEELVCSPLR